MASVIDEVHWRSIAVLDERGRQMSSAAVRRQPRSHEQRRRETQKSVLDATVDLLVERGYANLTLADVAAEAGVSRGAQMNYFRTKRDLVKAAARHAMIEAVRSASELAARTGRAEDPLETFIADSERFFMGKTYLAM